MVPFMFLFASALRLRDAPDGAGAIRIPGGRFTVCLAAVVGLVTTGASVIFAGIPAGDDPNKTLAVVKVIGLTVLLVGAGAAIYARGRRRALG